MSKVKWNWQKGEQSFDQVAVIRIDFNKALCNNFDLELLQEEF